MRTLYGFLRKVEDSWPLFDDEVTAKHKVARWLLHNVFGAKYWREVVLIQSEKMNCLKKSSQREIKHYEKKLEQVLRLYAAHIDSPKESRTNHQVEPKEVMGLSNEALSDVFSKPDSEFKVKEIK